MSRSLRDPNFNSYSISASSGVDAINSATFVEIANQNATIIAGGTVLIHCQADGSTTPMQNVGATGGQLRIMRDSTEIARWRFIGTIPLDFCTFVDVGAYGNVTYSIQAKTAGGAATITIRQIKTIVVNL